MAEKYPDISPFAYCANSPIRFTDPDGNNIADRVAGSIIGVITNVVPFSVGLRRLYKPTDAADYNNTLRTADQATLLLGLDLTKGGGAAAAAGTAVVIAAGEVTLSTGGLSVEVTAPAAAIGVVMVEAGVAATITGAVLMANGVINSSAGYHYGEESSENSSEGSSNESSGNESGGSEPESSNHKNFKKVSPSFLKDNGIEDIHAFKSEWLGTNKNLRLFDVVKNTDTKKLSIIRKSTQEVVQHTSKVVK